LRFSADEKDHFLFILGLVDPSDVGDKVDMCGEKSETGPGEASRKGTYVACGAVTPWRMDMYPLGRGGTGGTASSLTFSYDPSG
jgi:hypothetical protein